MEQVCTPLECLLPAGIVPTTYLYIYIYIYILSLRVRTYYNVLIDSGMILHYFETLIMHN